MEKVNSKNVKPRCVSARLVSVDRMGADSDDENKTRLLLGLDFGTQSYPQVVHRIVESDRFLISNKLIYKSAFGEFIYIEDQINLTVHVVIKEEPALYFYVDAYPLTLIKPKSVGNDHLSLLVTQGNTKKPSIMAGQKHADELQKQIDAMANGFVGTGCQPALDSSMQAVSDAAGNLLYVTGFVANDNIEPIDNVFAGCKPTSERVEVPIMGDADNRCFIANAVAINNAINEIGKSPAYLMQAFGRALRGPVLPNGNVGIDDIEDWQLAVDYEAMNQSVIDATRVSYGFVGVDFGTDHQAPAVDEKTWTRRKIKLSAGDNIIEAIERVNRDECQALDMKGNKFRNGDSITMVGNKEIRSIHCFDKLGWVMVDKDGNKIDINDHRVLPGYKYISEDAPFDTPAYTPRYIVDRRPGIIAVLDTHHPEYEPSSPGLHGNMVWVVASWSRYAYGVPLDTDKWQDNKAHNLAALLNGGAK